MKKIILSLLVIGLMIISFNFGKHWELSKTASYCQSIGQIISSSGPAYCVKNSHTNAEQ